MGIFSRIRPTRAQRPSLHASVCALVAAGTIAFSDPATAADTLLWQRYTLDFEGPQLSESPETFTDYRLTVEFEHLDSGMQYTVPGFFAADGQAADSGATSGTVWRAHFNPPREGEWTYSADLRTGAGVAASMDPAAGEAIALDNATGSFEVGPAIGDASASDFRTEGMVLQQPGSRYLSHAGSGGVWIKAGAGSPENLLGYVDFDATFDNNGQDGLHDYAPHLNDYSTGDPSWDGDRGRGLIGALNYLASEGVNSLYFLTMNVNGDGQDVWPWVAPDERLTYDVSKLAQWEIVFEHADSLGIALNIYTQEQENDQLLDGGSLGLERKIYYRELVARFGHHNGVFWNLGEENTNSDAQRKAFAERIEALDPYGHLISVHTFPGDKDSVFTPLLGFEPFDGAALQSRTGNVRADGLEWIAESDSAGDPWVVTWDESGPATRGVLPDGADGAPDNHADHREALWDFLTAGGAGSDWYFGYSFPDDDLGADDFRSRDSVWDWTVAAAEFFSDFLPVDAMSPADGLSPTAKARVFAAEGDTYALYLEDGGSAELDLSGQDGNYEVLWYDPLFGGGLQQGNVATVSGGAMVDLGNPPADADGEWTVLVTRTDDPPQNQPPIVEDATFTIQEDTEFFEFMIFANDVGTDPEGEDIFFDSATGAENGDTTLAGAGSILVYTPDPDYFGTETLEVTLSDRSAQGTNQTAATFEIIVESVNDAPVIDNTSFEFTPTDEIPSLDLAANDLGSDPEGETLFFDSSGNPENGESGLMGEGFFLRYTPNPGFVGTETFDVTISDRTAQGSDQVTATLTIEVGGDQTDPVYAINAGGNATEENGVAYAAGLDAQFVSGTTRTFGNADGGVLDSERWGADFSYNLPVDDGRYEVTLRFAEIFFNADNQRIFDVALEDETVIDDLDIHAEVGADAELERTFEAVIDDGEINLDFQASANNAKLSGLIVRQLEDGVPVATYTLFDTSNNSAIAQISDGDVIASGPLEGRNVTIVAEPASGGAVESVTFRFGDYNRTESVVPYALYGDTDGDFFAGTELSPGTYQLDTSYFDQDNGNGSQVAEDTVTFTVE
jgi:hypothetical protein